jgi:hypothetical protein
VEQIRQYLASAWFDPRSEIEPRREVVAQERKRNR